ncbi:hypothetical protein [Bdellovibrio bacteriovorus]|uniref:hypothetical protein n=1 Tax=Bdellovibrio bacteriovorus TaxID=959 RepID=UPI0035A606C4
MKFMGFVAIVLVTSSLQAQEAVSPAMRETIDKITKMRETLKVSADRSGAL